MTKGSETHPEEGHALIGSLVEGGPPTGDPDIVRSGLGIADVTRGDRVGPGPEDYLTEPAPATTMSHYRFGPLLTENGVLFRLFAPSADGVELLMPDRAPVTMARDDEGWFAAEILGAGPGTRYAFRTGGLDAGPCLARTGRGCTRLERRARADAAGRTALRAPLA